MSEEGEFTKVEVADKLLKASPILQRSVAVALLGAAQFGWMLSEMGHLPFNNASLCRQADIPEGQCLLYPGHTTAQWTMQSTAWALGGALGALASAFLADTYGRKHTLGVNGLVMILGGLVQMLAPDMETFALGRGVSGIASGVAVNVLNNYLREVAPKQWRMFYMTLFHITMGFTAVVVSALMFAIPKVPTSAWQFKPLFGGPIVIGGLQLATMRFIVESPMWLLHRHRDTEAKQAVSQLYMSGDIDIYFVELAESMRAQTEESEAASSMLGLLVSPRYRVQFVIAVVLGTMQQLAGMSALVVYGPSIFKAIGLADLRLANIFMNYGRTHNMIIAALIGDRFNRRTLLVRLSVVMALAALGFTLCQVYMNDTSKYVVLVMLIFCVTSYTLSVGSLGWLVSTELLPEALAPTSGSFATFGTWMAQLFIGVYFQQISSPTHWGTQAFAIFAVLTLLFAVLAYAYVPETRLTTTDQVTAIFTRDNQDMFD
ncbi:unnamed protein product, partial [Aphanomyces euteiches]